MRNLLKRVLPGALLCLAVIPAVSQAGWVTKEINWQVSSQGSPYNAGAIYVRDTMYTAIGPVDTTGDFSLDDAAPPPRGFGAPAGVLASGSSAAAVAFNDTTTIAWITIQSDSSAAPTSGLTSATMFLDGRVGAFGPAITLARGWVKADSALVNGAAGGTLITGNESFAFPIRSISPYGQVLRWSNLRARISAAGTALSAARVFVRYWKN